jgi:hypothetical protein
MPVALVMICLVALLSGATVNATVFSSQEWGTITPEERLLQAPPGSPDAGAVFIFDKGFVVTELDGPKLERHVRIKILDSSIIAKLTPTVIESIWYDEIHDVEALVDRLNGTQIKIDKKNITEFQDQTKRTVTITFPDLKPGDIIEYRYQISYYGGADKLGAEKYFLFSQAVSWQWVKDRKDKLVELDDLELQKVANIPMWYFDNIGPTLYSQYIVKLGANLDYSCVASNLPQDKQEPEVRRGKGIIDRVYVYYTWTMENTPAIQPEAFMPRPNDFRPSLYFDLFSSPGENRIIMGTVADTHWNYVGQNFQGYLSMYVGKLREVKSETMKILEGLTSQESKARRLYEYVHDNYSADSAGYRMRAAHKNLTEFRKQKTGAPFESNILLVEMLKAADIQAWPVLISTRSEAEFRRTGRFNHLIVCASMNVGAIYLDASSKTCRYGALPPQCLVTEGVRVDFDDSRAQLILTGAQDSYRVDSVHLRVEADGSWSGLRVSSLSGYAAMEFRERLVRKDVADRNCPMIVSDYALLDSMRWNCDSLGRCEAESVARTDAVAPSANLSLVMPVATWMMSNPLVSDKRFQPVDFVYPFRYESVAIFNNENGAGGVVLPEGTSFRIAGASFWRDARLVGDSISVTVGLKIDKAVFAVNEYAALHEFFDRVVEVCRQPLQLSQ